MSTSLDSFPTGASFHMSSPLTPGMDPDPDPDMDQGQSFSIGVPIARNPASGGTNLRNWFSQNGPSSTAPTTPPAAQTPPTASTPQQPQPKQRSPKEDWVSRQMDQLGPIHPNLGVFLHGPMRHRTPAQAMAHYANQYDRMNAGGNSGGLQTPTMTGDASGFTPQKDWDAQFKPRLGTPAADRPTPDFHPAATTPAGTFGIQVGNTIPNGLFGQQSGVRNSFIADSDVGRVSVGRGTMSTSDDGTKTITSPYGTASYGRPSPAPSAPDIHPSSPSAYDDPYGLASTNLPPGSGDDTGADPRLNALDVIR